MTLEAGEILTDAYVMIEVTLATGVTPAKGDLISAGASGWTIAADSDTGNSAMYYAYDSGSQKHTAVVRGLVSLNGSGSGVAGYTCLAASTGSVSATNTRAAATFGLIVDVTDDPVWKVLL